MPSRDEIREQVLNAIDAYRLENNERGRGMLDIEPTADALMSLIDQQIREARINELQRLDEGELHQGTNTHVRFIPVSKFNRRIAQLSTKPQEREQ